MSNISCNSYDPTNPFHYMPWMDVAIISLVLYSVSFGILLLWTVQRRCWYMTPILVGLVMEIVGYGTRVPLAFNPCGQISLYICMDVCILLAPVFYAAAEYIVLGRLMHAVGDQYSLVKPSLVAWIFILCDIVSLVIQSAGAGVLTSAFNVGNIKQAQLGENILLGGLGVNLVSFSIFCLQLFYFDYRTRTSPTLSVSYAIKGNKSWRPLLYSLYLSSFFVLLRQIYRVIEFSQGFTGYLAIHEIYFYVFDCLPIIVAGAAFAIIFPGNGYLPRNQKDTFANIQDNHLEGVI